MAADTKSDSLVGFSIGNYKVVQQIGEGGMGVVYLAEHPVIGRKVAIKLLHQSFAKDSDTVARFFNEARAIHMIGHPNIVEILDFGQTADGQPYFIMEYLAGEPLAEKVARGPMGVVDSVEIVSQICDALQAAHDKNVIHRDLKPHNVYLVGMGPHQSVKILDFGVAKIVGGWDTSQSGGKSVKTRTGSLMGTPLYMSPEQCRGSGTLDHRTDIYSLAVILFEMISGRPPFIAEGVGELFAKHMLEAPPSLAEFAPRTPPHIVRAVARALAKNIDERYPTMRAFRDALNGKPDALPAGAGGARPRSAVSHHATLPIRNHPTAQEGALPPEQTTLSSLASELDDDLVRVPSRSRKGLVIGLALAAVVAVVLLAVTRKSNLSGKSTTETSGSTGTTAHPDQATPNRTPTPTPTPTPPETVNIRVEAEPAGTHVFGKVQGETELSDLGQAPLELKLPRASEPLAYVLRSDGYKERPISVEPSRDQVLRFALDPTPAPEKRPVKPPARPLKPRRPAVHDADGLAVPSF